MHTPEISASTKRRPIFCAKEVLSGTPSSLEKVGTSGPRIFFVLGTVACYLKLLLLWSLCVAAKMGPLGRTQHYTTLQSRAVIQYPSHPKEYSKKPPVSRDTGYEVYIHIQNHVVYCCLLTGNPWC